jgi:thioredoxin reductase
MHAFLSRDRIAPDELRRLAHADLRRYPNVEFRQAEVKSAAREKDGTFSVAVGRASVKCRKLLIATGVYDHLPRIDRIEEFFGRSVFQCPYCDGWEVRDRPVAVYGRGQRGFDMARALTTWTEDIVLCTDGPARLSKTDRTYLDRIGIEIREERIETLEGDRGKLRAILFHGGSALRRSVLFFDTPSSGQSKLAESLGCQFNRKGGIRCGDYEATSVPGVFVAGNIIRDVQLSIVAAAEGARAAFGINRALTREDFDRRTTGARRVEHPPLEVSTAREGRTRRA